MVAEGARAPKQEPTPPPFRASADRTVRERQTSPVDLDRLIHGRVRLGIVSALAVEPSLAFNELKKRIETSAGNLSVHARRLEEGGYLEVRKSFEGRLPKTEYRLTPAGREALERYLDHMEALIGMIRD